MKTGNRDDRLPGVSCNIVNNEYGNIFVAGYIIFVQGVMDARLDLGVVADA
ncbi:MAG: hypothetical protein RAO75_00185 [Candidatus Chlorobium antarcticum]|jgi:hypothetical protein|nr:hypothetical protein [Candidatus Chlorobium antarcticum]